LGLFESGGYNYVFANHEIGATKASAISSTVPGQIKGARGVPEEKGAIVDSVNGNQEQSYERP
jgi:hypothetical protein